MPRKLRIDTADNYYHCINRANARLKIHFSKKDFNIFNKTLFEAQKKFSTDILAFVIMSNHFHLVIKTKFEGELSAFMKWFSTTHTQRWHAVNNNFGTGHLYQGRYKSFLIKNQKHLETVIRYVERNPLTAGLVKNILDWKYSSLYQRYLKPRNKTVVKLAEWPYEIPFDYLENLSKPISDKEIAKSLEIEMELDRRRKGDIKVASEGKNNKKYKETPNKNGSKIQKCG